jgi:ankyrin repeat protein
MADDEDPFTDMFEHEALHFAAGHGDLGRVKRLLAEGHPINAFDDLSWTPLHHAADRHHLDVVRHLIASGADVNARDEKRIGDTVLKLVAETCSLELARILVNAGADPTIPGWMGLTALDKSVNRKRFEGPDVHRLLLEAARLRHPLWPRLDDFSSKRNREHNESYDKQSKNRKRRRQ